jgi:sulfatase modifying factor 1
MPLTCIEREHARSVCELLGKRLPSEAEWEWAAGNRERETPFPWGYAGEERSSEVCARTVIARSASLETGQDAFECRSANGMDLPPGPQAGGLPSDVNEGGIRNLSGNVAEWVADDFASYDDGCWSGETKLLTDPICRSSSSSLFVPTERGGSWAAHPYSARVVERSAGPAGSWTNYTGFRCAKGM